MNSPVMKPTSRETLFECTYSSPAVVRTAHVRAWDLGEAVTLFEDELRGDGVSERGEIRARPTRGGRARIFPYRPH
jgi:hypothetical protein